jgi:hypothetical protein
MCPPPAHAVTAAAPACRCAKKSSPAPHGTSAPRKRSQPQGIVHGVSGLVIIEENVTLAQVPFREMFTPQLKRGIVIAALITPSRSLQADVGEIRG